MAMALSKMIAASGYVLFETAKNEECPLSILNAHRERKYNPIPDVNPANTIIQTPINRPIDDIAAGIATKVRVDQNQFRVPNIPAPTQSMSAFPREKGTEVLPRIVLARLIALDPNPASPRWPEIFFRRGEGVRDRRPGFALNMSSEARWSSRSVVGTPRYDPESMSIYGSDLLITFLSNSRCL